MCSSAVYHCPLRRPTGTCANCSCAIRDALPPPCPAPKPGACASSVCGTEQAVCSRHGWGRTSPVSRSGPRRSSQSCMPGWRRGDRGDPWAEVPSCGRAWHSRPAVRRTTCPVPYASPPHRRRGAGRAPRRRAPWQRPYGRGDQIAPADTAACRPRHRPRRRPRAAPRPPGNPVGNTGGGPAPAHRVRGEDAVTAGASGSGQSAARCPVGGTTR